MPGYSPAPLSASPCSRFIAHLPLLRRNFRCDFGRIAARLAALVQRIYRGAPARNESRERVRRADRAPMVTALKACGAPTYWVSLAFQFCCLTPRAILSG